MNDAPSLQPAGAPVAPATPPPLPPGFLCPQCAYELGNLPASICPECGTHLPDQDVHRHHARIAACAAFPRLLLRHLLIAAAVITATAILAAALARRGDGRQLLVSAGAVTGLALGGSLALGLLASLGARPHERRAVMIAWLHSYLWLHGPWLCMPALVLFLGLAGALDRALNLAGDGQGVLAPLALGILILSWLAWATVSMIAWGPIWRGRLDRLGVRHKRRLLGVVVVAVLTGLASLAMGLVGGVVGILVGGEMP